MTETEVLNRQVDTWLGSFARAIGQGNSADIAALFETGGFWRDLLAFTWNIKTMEAQDQIAAMLDTRLADTAPQNWARHGEAEQTEDGVAAWLTFETELATCKGRVTLRNGLCHILFTAMESLRGHEEPLGHRRLKGLVHRADRSRKTWLEQRTETAERLGTDEQPEVVIIGGGQGGVALAARLKQLDVPALVIERNPRIGDSWRNRYRSLVLHDPVWYDHLPYLPFPENWPVFCPKDKIGDWLEAYAMIMELDVWTSSNCEKAVWSDDERRWSVRVSRDGKATDLTPRQLVFCTGAYGPPRLPEFAGQGDFGGTLLHSSAYADGADHVGKCAVVIGAGSSAHDVAVDLWEAGAEVTMLQRRPSIVVRSETLMKHGFDLYSQDAMERGVSVDDADMLSASTPYALFADKQRELYRTIRKEDSAFYDKLADAGFLFDFGEDDTGLMMRALRTASGYYIDVGASSLIADGHIKVVAGDAIDRFIADGLQLASGRTIDADVVIACTGYHSMHEAVAGIVDRETADRVGPCWGLGSGVQGDPGPWEGELRNMWKPTAHEALWFHGGNLALSRFYSNFVALQLKARQLGMPIRPYGSPVDPTATL